MTYELCKQLKDAGFPQIIRIQTSYYKNNGEEQHPSYSVDGGDCIVNPTFSELIKECGEKFYALNFNRGFKIKWMAEGVLSDDTIIGEAARTPEEAVAKLWLELNKDGNNK